MSIDESDAMIAPKSEDKDRVMSWLRNSLENAYLGAGGDHIVVTTQAKQVERLLDTAMYTFTHDNGHAVELQANCSGT